MSKIISANLQIAPYIRVFENRAWDTDEADVRLLSQAAELLGERAYATEKGLVRVRFDWGPLVERRRRDVERSALLDPDADEPLPATPPAEVTVKIDDERGYGRDYEVDSCLELFLYESFLMLNVAVPGSFGGRIRWSWDIGDREVSFDARVFEVAAVTAAMREWPRIEPLPLPAVKAWYDALGIGIQQVATTSTARTLFHLLYLARGEEEDTMSVVRLALALEAIFEARGPLLGPRIESILGPTGSLDEELRRFLDDRNAMILGTAPVAHPMYDDSLDPRADDASFDYTDVVDFASRVIVAALQQQVRSFRPLRLV